MRKTENCKRSQMVQEFQVDPSLSNKLLNNVSTSLVIPQITRYKIFQSMYFKVNLHPCNLRGDTIKHLAKILIRDLGSCEKRKSIHLNVCGGIEFKCLLMKLINIKPTLSQLNILLNLRNFNDEFNDKYIIVLLLVYFRLQYYYVSEKIYASDDKINAIFLKKIFRQYLQDYRKVKTYPLSTDCWSSSVEKKVEIIHVDEIIDWLCTKNEIWGIPMGKCTWCDIFDSDDTSSDDTGSDSSNDSEDSN